MRTTMAVLAFALLASTAPAAPRQAADAESVIAAERAFAARAGEVGVGPSFLEFMRDDAIVFSPDPLLARAVWEAAPAAPAPKDGGPLLTWWPNFAGVSRSGDLAFTTGPAASNRKAPGLFYFTVWARRPGGPWKWIFDGGVAADASHAPQAGTAPLVLPAGDAAPLAPAVAMDQVRTAEIALAARARTGVAAAYKAVLAPDARVQGSSLAPATAPDAVDRELATRARTIAFGPLGGSASAAGDLAWTYGDARWAGGRGHYVRVWQRRGGRWRLVFDQIVTVEAPA